MHALYSLVALVATVSGAAIERALEPRMTTPSPGCAPGWEAISDPYFGGDGSDYGLSTPTGDLQVKTAWTTPHGLAADPNNGAAFAFKVLSGSGNFTIYQDVCLATGDNQIYNASYHVGVTSPGTNVGDSPSGCDVVFSLNNHITSRPVPVCELPTAQNPFGICNEASTDPATKYVHNSMIFTVEQPIARVAVQFICTAQANSAQVVLDSWTIMHQVKVVASS